MKKIIIFLICFVPNFVFAYIGPLDEGSFWINNQSTQPFSFNISSNSNTTVNFHLAWTFNHSSSANIDLPGSYLFFSVVSDKKIDITRLNSFGSSCTQSCFSNDKYLQLIDSDNNSYSYVFYFNIVKWARNVGTQVDLFNVDDTFKFINKESGIAHVYIYGVYSDTTNQIPQYINNADTIQQVIIDGQTNADMIINNQNQNTQDIIDSQLSCTYYNKTSIEKDNSYLDSSGTIQTNNNYGVSKFFKIDSNSKIKLTTTHDGGAYSCFYDSNKTMISCIKQNTISLNSLLTIPNNAEYFRFSIFKSSDRPQYEICVNGNQATTDAINGLNDNITNSGIDSPNSDFSDMEDMLAENGVITNLLSLPITLYSKILNSVNGTCSSYNLGTLFGSSITFSCISLQTLLGNTIWGVIDILFSGFTIYAISKKMIKVFNSMSSLKEGDVIDD